MLYPAELRVRRGECIARAFGTCAGNGRWHAFGWGELAGPRPGAQLSYPENFSEGAVDHDSEARFNAHASWAAALESCLSN
jgi:hypothetical protein